MLVRQIYDEGLSQYAYLIGCQQTGEALVIDPERDVDRYLAVAAAEGLRVTAAAETHIHADFVSGARELADRGAIAYLLGRRRCRQYVCLAGHGAVTSSAGWATVTVFGSATSSFAPFIHRDIRRNI